MYCRNSDPRIDAYLDGQLDPGADADVIAGVTTHLATCVSCAAEASAHTRETQQVRRSLPYYRASDQLRSRIVAVTAASEPAAERPVRIAAAPSLRALRRWQALAIAASVLLAIVSVPRLRQTVVLQSTMDSATHEIVSAHVRSLMGEHLLDVKSSDRHNVKPWFEGRISFSPTVFDFASDSFPLAGGRLDYVTDRPVAVIVFRHGAHAVNLFVWPSDSAASSVKSSSLQGNNVITWRRNGMRYTAVSTAAAGTLRRFADLYLTRDSLTTGSGAAVPK